MPKLFCCNTGLLKNRKAQWFLISAVFVSSAFLLLSILFRSYTTIDTSSVVRSRENIVFEDVKQQLNKVVDYNCDNISTRLDEFIEFAEKKLAEEGYNLDVSYSINLCTVVFDMEVSSESMNITSSWKHSGE